MKVHTTEEIRNVALAGHTHAGKTSLAEAMLWVSGQIDKLGKTDDGNTLSDYDPEEVRRKISIQTSILPLEHEGTKINLLDLPGVKDFVGEIQAGLWAGDSMLLVHDATGDLGTGSEYVWGLADQHKLPRAIFINRLDKEHASFEKSMQALADQLEVRLIPLTLPVGEEAELRGVVDLLKMKVAVQDGQKTTYEDIPAELAEAAKEARAALIEAAAEGDEELLEKFLSDEDLSPAEVLRGLHEDVVEGGIVPVLCGSATELVGIRPLLDFILHCLPNPNEALPYQVKDGEGTKDQKIAADAPAAAFVFKTVIDPFAGKLSFFKVLGGTLKTDDHLQNVTQNVDERLAHLLNCVGKKNENIEELSAGDIGAIAKHDQTHTYDTLVNSGAAAFEVVPPALPKHTAFAAVHAKTRADEDKVGIGFHRLIEQDPTLEVRRDPSVQQTILAGMGDMHLEVAAHRIKDLSKVEIEMETPRVPYRETITKSAEGQGKHKKQSGGHGQYGDCWVRFDPLPEGSGFEFDWAIVGGVIPTNFQSAVEKGLQEAMERGVLSGCQTVDIKATCYDGSYHSVDSSDMAFKVAASLAFKNVIPSCGPIVLEPVNKVTITVPEEYMGDVMGDLNGRRGRILGMNPNGKKQVIEAMVPLSELFTYGRQLRSLTQGRGEFETEFDHYERVPGDVQDKIIAEAKKRQEEENG